MGHVMLPRWKTQVGVGVTDGVKVGVGVGVSAGVCVIACKGVLVDVDDE